ncbi:hypothetical protein V1498_18440 [Peribacillus sp. SCS-26]|uniref:hypothetical protein n=1 Tax=Paraperibacillus marinus TaxID=3115295 RepID=UPI003905CBA0
MKKRDEEHISEEQSAEGLMQLFEIINAKGDTGELQSIGDEYEAKNAERNADSTEGMNAQPSQGPSGSHSMACNEELFYNDLRAIAEDSSKED